MGSFLADTKSKIGDNFIKSKITISKSSLIFSPDPLFLKEAVSNSEYRKIKFDTNLIRD